MGVHLLLLLLCLSWLPASLQALKCVQCQRFNASGVCESKESVCETRGSQECFLRKVYEGRRLQYGYQGCEDLCIPMSFFTPNTDLVLKCCSDHSFCNKFQPEPSWSSSALRRLARKPASTQPATVSFTA